jgi:hypothetical protein
MSPGRFEHSQPMIGSPLEQVAKVVPVGVEGSSAVGGQKRDGCQFGWIDGEVAPWSLDSRGDSGHWNPSLW